MAEEPQSQLQPKSSIAVEKGEATEAQLKEIEEGHFFTVKQVAGILNYSVAWITRLCQVKRIKGIKPTGSSWRIPGSEFERLKKEGIPPLPRVKPPIPGTDITVSEEQLSKVIPEKKEAKEAEPSGVGWPLSIIFKSGKEK